MKVFKKILCPIDFSEYSRLALRYASALSQENDAPLIVCHSVPDFSQELSYLEGNHLETVREALISNAKEKLEEFVGPRVQAAKKILQGNPTEAILQTVKAAACDLIVMGTHGHSGYERYFMGSVTNKILHKSTVPVLTVCRQTHHFIRDSQVRPVEIKRILCALDYEENSRKVSKLALEIGRMYGAEIIFFHSVPNVDTDDWIDQKDWVKNKLQQYVGVPEDDLCAVKFLVLAGDPVQWIVQMVKGNEIDLVVLGHHSKTPDEEIFLGSVAKRVLTKAICPVLVARSHLDLRSEGLLLN
jgi:nucleotide-binding universal stress UspA family protein